MANPGLLYGGTPADFVVAQGAEAEIYEPGVNPEDPPMPSGAFGSAVLLPLAAQTFQIYDAPGGVAFAELWDVNQVALSPAEITSETTFARRGTLPLFYAPDTHQGDVYASGDGVVFYRLMPATDTLFQRMTAVEQSGGGNGLATTDLTDWSNATPSHNDTVKYNSGTGLWEPLGGVQPTNFDDLADVDLSSGGHTGETIVQTAGGTIRKGVPALVPWNNISPKPATYPPSAHTHDDRYYTRQQIDDLVGGNGALIESIPSLDRMETVTPGTYPARGTAREDLVITWVGTMQPPIAAAGGATDFVTEGVAMDGVDRFFRVDS